MLASRFRQETQERSFEKLSRWSQNWKTIQTTKESVWRGIEFRFGCLFVYVTFTLIFKSISPPPYSVSVTFIFWCFVSQQMEIDDDEDDEEEAVYFSAQDLLKLREGIVLLVRTLLKLLERFSLRDKPQSADSCVQVSQWWRNDQ